MKISIITVNRNNAEGLRKTLDSVVSQSVRPYEFIVIDGASDDGSADLLQAYGAVITCGISEPDNGIYNAMNKGVGKACGDWCLFLNSGDTLSSDNVLERLERLDSHADIICGSVLLMEETPRLKEAPDEITFDFLFSGSLCHQGALISRSLLLKYPYDENLRIVADRKFFVQALICDNCSYEKTDVCIAHYDVSGYSATHRFESEQEYAHVLEELVPYRIRMDYGRRIDGCLYGDTSYEKLFAEIGRRNWRRPIYLLVRGLLRSLSPIVRSARFEREI